jgi:hypothetical protein
MPLSKNTKEAIKSYHSISEKDMLLLKIRRPNSQYASAIFMQQYCIKPIAKIK